MMYSCGKNGQWLFLAMFTILLCVLLCKGHPLRTRFGNPQVENHVIEAKGGSRAEINAACEDRIDGGQCGSRYDVFLSFRGPDTRFDLADVLYEFMRGAGIHVFRDYEELRRGEEIAGQIRRAIYDSKIYIVIFSPTYAKSTWCLRELAMIAKCRIDCDGNGKIIMPVFYRVDPNDVKLKTSLYREPIDRHRLRYEADMVQEWEDVLKTVAKIRGWVSSDIQGQGKLASLVLQDVVSRLKIIERYVPCYMTGIDDQVDGVMELLDRDSFDVHGPRGEVGDGFDGINEIRRRFCDKKVLIDVNKADQLKMFVGRSKCLRAGSRILVTTRAVCRKIWFVLLKLSNWTIITPFKYSMGVLSALTSCWAICLSYVERSLTDDDNYC